MNLVIVESPTKAKTIGRILGDDYVVKSSYGHIRDLPEARLGVDINNGFTPFYVIDRRRLDLVNELREEANNAETLLLATDQDREGEAIAWDLLQVIGEDRVVYNRIHFSEIVKEVIEKAIQSTQSINMDVVYAQRARRILDRLIGYPLSDLLRRRVGRGITAGRVQSPAVKIIVDRERERKEFITKEYWTIDVELRSSLDSNKGKETFIAKLIGTKAENKVVISSEQEACDIEQKLEQAKYRITDIQTNPLTYQPSPPFITSTLQREASSKLHFTVKRTMSVAQQLYEGIDLGDEEPCGLITYMRTDATRLADSAITEVREYIKERIGVTSLSPKTRIFSGNTKWAQEGHEAIRPTSILREPSLIRQYLKPEQFNLYELVWKRTVATQMAVAKSERTTINIEAIDEKSKTEYLLRITVSQIKSPGFMSLYTETREETDEEDSINTPAPELEKGDTLSIVAVNPEQHFTKPPPRFTESTLVKILEQNGIGRPSTYSPTITTIQAKYTTRVNGAFEPTEAAFIVTDLLCEFFPEIVDIQFTSQMEQELDEIAQGNRTWISVLDNFYTPFQKRLDFATANMEKVRLPDRVTTEVCPECLTKHGHTRYLVVKNGPTGIFLGCPGYNDEEYPCSYTQPYRIRIGVKCPESGCNGELVELISNKGRVFYGCNNCPECTFKTNNKPVPEPCPMCNGLMTDYRNNQVRCISCRHTLTREPND